MLTEQECPGHLEKNGSVRVILKAVITSGFRFRRLFDGDARRFGTVRTKSMVRDIFVGRKRTNPFFGDVDDRLDVDSGVASVVFRVNSCLITDVRLLLVFACSSFRFGLTISLDGDGVVGRLVAFDVVSD